MKIKSVSSLAIGVAVGYGLNTPTGRQLVSRVGSTVRSLLGRPAAQQKVSDLADAARTKAQDLPDQATGLANAAVDAAEKAVKDAGDTGHATA